MHIGEKVVSLTNCAGKTEYAQENSALDLRLAPYKASTQMT